MAITISGSGITSANIADGAITASDISSAVELGVTDAEKVNLKSGRKNLLINGGFDVWQRGTSFSGYNFYSADRWKTNVSVVPTSQTFDRVQELDTNFMRWQCTTSGVAVLQQRIEGNYIAGKTVTLSFKAKGSGTLASLYLKNKNNGSTGTQQTIATNITIPTTLTAFSYTFTVDSVTNVPIDGDYISLELACDNTSVDLYITGVQLELGSVATDFEHRSYGEELALCQRYYQYGDWLHFSRYVTKEFTPEMRVSPTLTNVKTQGTSYTIGAVNARRFEIHEGSDATKRGSWTADAEL